MIEHSLTLTNYILRFESTNYSTLKVIIPNLPYMNMENLVQSVRTVSEFTAIPCEIQNEDTKSDSYS